MKMTNRPRVYKMNYMFEAFPNNFPMGMFHWSTQNVWSKNLCTHSLQQITGVLVMFDPLGYCWWNAMLILFIFSFPGKD